MSGYIDLQREAEEAFQEREYRRRRLMAGIRGSLRRYAQPRWLVVYALLISALPGAAIGYGVHALGMNAWGPVEAVAVLCMWPIFVHVAWRTAGLLAEKIDVLADLEASVSYDLSCEAKENANFYGSQYGDIGLGVEGREGRGFWAEFQKGLGQNAGQMGAAWPIVVVILILITAGSWLVWRLICYGPMLLSELIFDDYLIRKMPKLADQANLEPAIGNAFMATAFHFVGFAVVMVLLGFIIHCIPLTGWLRR